MPSLWTADTDPLRFPPLPQDVSCDLVVVGAGIAGLSSAYEASRCGLALVVIDRMGLAQGMTGRSTAHLTSEIDDRYFELIEVVGEDNARLYHDSQVAAINRIETVCADEEIDASFTRLPGYLVAAEPEHQSDLEKEYDACRKLGVDVEWTSQAPLTLPAGARSLRFAGQGRLNPLKYCEGLAQAILQRGGHIYGNTAYVDHETDGGGVIVRTENDRHIRAGAALFATNSPVNDRFAIHTKQVPMRTYAIAGRVPAGSVEDALVWDTLEAYHYVRLQPAAAPGLDWLIAGGEDHRSGTANDMDARFDRLERWTRERFPAFVKAEHRWSGQVMEPVDSLPYSGSEQSGRIYVHTGDSGQGITNAVAGALNFLALYRNGKARFGDLFDPARKPRRGASIGEYVKGQGPVVANLGEYLGAGEVDDIEQIKPGEGAILRRGLSKLAVYRAEDGTATELNAACTHVGCIVHWNSFEKCWDCPCHGSQFRPDGSVLNAPAVHPLAAAAGE